LSIFRRKEQAKVPFSGNTIAKCICSKCPVQTQSMCAISKNQKLMEAMNMSQLTPNGNEYNAPMGGEMMVQANPSNQKTILPKPEEVAGLYCANGTAACKDLSGNKACICGQCAVYAEYKLSGAKPVEHFCFNGNSQ
jgi:hypothetical protein